MNKEKSTIDVDSKRTERLARLTELRSRRVCIENDLNFLWKRLFFILESSSKIKSC
jgi:hypothetical protein